MIEETVATTLCKTNSKAGKRVRARAHIYTHTHTQNLRKIPIPFHLKSTLLPSAHAYEN